MHKLRMPVLISSYIPHQFHSYAHPCGISDHLLSHARAQRQYVQLAIFAADEAAEQEAARGAGKEDVAIERTGKCGGHQPFAPNFIATARSEEHTSELQSLMRNSSAVFCLKHTKRKPTSTKRNR